MFCHTRYKIAVCVDWSLRFCGYDLYVLALYDNKYIFSLCVRTKDIPGYFPDIPRIR